MLEIKADWEHDSDNYSYYPMLNTVFYWNKKKGRHTICYVNEDGFLSKRVSCLRDVFNKYKILRY